MKKSFLVPLLLLTLMSSIGACSLNKPDLRYRDSRLLAPLAVPDGLDSPQYSPSMDIPPVGSPGAPAGQATSPDGLEIEQPPDMRATDSQGPGKD